MGKLDRNISEIAPYAVGSANASSAADYIANLSDELGSMARSYNLDVLGTLLNLAAIEARRIASSTH